MTSYLQTSGIARRIGDRIIFDGADININRDDKIAVVGVNGCGKSSLLDIISGRESPDEGSVTAARDLRISYLDQSPSLNDNNTIIDELFDEGTLITNLIRDYEKSLLSGDEKLMQKLTQQMDDHKAWDFEVSVKQILFRLKLFDLNARIKTLSGGERKRVALAKTLVHESDLLILDEPTNHLDIDMIEWLEEYLANSVRTLMMVTHDRYFLDRICTCVYEISDKKVFRYDGNYAWFLEKKEQYESSVMSNTEKARNLFRTELEWMRRMPKARRHKSKSRIGSFNDLREKTKLPSQEKRININVDISRMGKKILEIKNVSKSYGSKKLINDFSYNFARFEKAGIVGPNGAGKTTLFNIISGSETPDNGIIETGETVKFGYYRQEGMVFDEEMTVIDAVVKIAEKVTLNDGRVVTASGFLNYFLFPPDRQRTFIKKLSGGEKRRLYLLTVLMQSPNFLLLDEPTNDLDILTLNVLEEYLADFKGCVLAASHDRYFLDKISDHIFEYRDDGIIKDFPGNYTQLRNYRDEIELELQAKNKQKSPVKDILARVNQINENKRGLTWKEKKEMEQLESEIQNLEDKKGAIESDIASGSLSPGELRDKSEKFSELMKNLDDKELRWLELKEKDL
jgi:ABC transport system ATP-binding/permease protein